MSNYIKDYLTELTGAPVSNPQLLNQIRRKASPTYQALMPEIDTSIHSTINHVNAPSFEYSSVQNEFIDTIVNKLGPNIIKWVNFKNPLGIFRTEKIASGNGLEEIYIAPAIMQNYDPDSTDSPFTKSKPVVGSMYHTSFRRGFYEHTIERNWTLQAFTSEQSFDNFINGIFDTLVQGDEMDEYEVMRNLVTDSLQTVTLGGNNYRAPHMEIDITLPNYTETLAKSMLVKSNLFSTPSRSRFENGAQVPKTTTFDEQYFIVDAERAADMDVMLARAFHMDKLTIDAKKIVVDQFPTFSGAGDLNGAKPFAALISKDSFILKDAWLAMANIFNPRDYTYNYYYHHHELISYSLYENSCVFIEKL